MNKQFRVKCITVHAPGEEFEYDVDCPSWQPKTLHEILTEHPALTSIVVTFIPVETKQ